MDKWNPFLTPTSESTAPRPHWITVLLGAMSPVLGIAALLISWRSYAISTNSVLVSEQSLATAQMSMKAGQRAYLYVRNSSAELTFSNVANPEGVFAGCGIEFDVLNMGNTPATIEAINIKFSHDDSWTEAPPVPEAFVKDTTHIRDVVIGPKLTVRLMQGMLFSLTDFGKQRLKRFDLLTFLRRTFFDIQASFSYTDVFGDSHQVAWAHSCVRPDKAAISYK
jgi:hypothetical protein